MKFPAISKSRSFKIYGTGSHGMSIVFCYPMNISGFSIND